MIHAKLFDSARPFRRIERSAARSVSPRPMPPTPLSPMPKAIFGVPLLSFGGAGTC